MLHVSVYLQVKMGCPNSDCERFVHRDEIMVRLSGPIKDKFFRFLVDANKEAHIKTCPKCSTVTTLDKVSDENMYQLKKELMRQVFSDAGGNQRLTTLYVGSNIVRVLRN